MGKAAKMRQKSVEIESLGSIFKGAWDKRYWSSSRGKNRYPFPVGYKARAKNGSDTYTLEIREHRAGPLFVVSCGEMQTTGTSPNSAWEAMVKSRHPGTRSLSITGVEMFGFVDPVVQYLLRELVASSEQDEPHEKVESSPRDLPLGRNDSFCSAVVREASRKRVLSPAPSENGVSQPHKLGRTSEGGGNDDATNSQDSCPKNVYVSDSEPEPEPEPRIVPDTLEVSDLKAEKQKKVQADRIVPDTLEVMDKMETETKVSAGRNHSSQNEAPDEMLTSQQMLAASSSEENQSESDLLAKSMISLLLPNAVPFMKTYSRRQKKKPASYKRGEQVILRGQSSKVGTTGVPKVLLEEVEVREPENAPFAEESCHQKLNISITQESEARQESVLEQSQVQHTNVSRGQLQLAGDIPSRRPEVNEINRPLAEVTLDLSRTLQKQTDTNEEVPAIAIDVAVNHTTLNHTDLDPDPPASEERYGTPEKQLDSTEPRYVKNLVEDSRAETREEKSANSAPHNETLSSITITDTSEKAAETAQTTSNSVENHLKPVNKELTRSDMLQPVAAFEHEYPVLCAALDARSQEVDISIYCDTPGGIQLYVYRVSVANVLLPKAKLLLSLCLAPCRHCEEVSLKLQLEVGVRFTPDGDNLVFLGGFSLQNPEVSNQPNVVRVVSLADYDPKVKLELVMDTAVRCLLITGPFSLIAGGDGGCIREWRLDSSWRKCEHETNLPSANYDGRPFRSILKLVRVSHASNILLGCDPDGHFAIWDIFKQQLLSSSYREGYIFSNIHLVDHSLMDNLENPCVCVLADIKEHTKRQSHWRVIVIKNNDLFFGNQFSNRICTAACMGRYGVAGTDEGRVFLWEFSTGRSVIEMLEQESKIVQINTATSSSVLLTVGQDGRAILYV